jgi:hypothetical protein
MLYIKEKKKINESVDNKEVVAEESYTGKIINTPDGYKYKIGKVIENGIYEELDPVTDRVVGEIASPHIEKYLKEELKTIDEGIQSKEYKPGQEIEYELKEGDNIPEGLSVGKKIKGKITKVNDGKADIEWQNKEKDTDFDLSKL